MRRPPCLPLSHQLVSQAEVLRTPQENRRFLRTTATHPARLGHLDRRVDVAGLGYSRVAGEQDFGTPDDPWIEKEVVPESPGFPTRARPLHLGGNEILASPDGESVFGIRTKNGDHGFTFRI